MHLAVVMFCLVCVDSQVYKSIQRMKQLAHTERALFNIISGTLAVQRSLLEDLRDISTQFGKIETLPGALDVENPLDSYRLLKRMTMAIAALERISQASTVNGHVTASLRDLRQNFVVPSLEDWHGTAGALLRAKVLLDAPASDMVEGRFASVRAYNRLDADDCLRLGKIRMLLGDLSGAIEWLGQVAAGDYAKKTWRSEMADYTAALDVQLQDFKRHLRANNGDDSYANQLREELMRIGTHKWLHKSPAEPALTRQWLYDSDSQGFNASAIRDDHVETVHGYAPLCRGQIGVSVKKLKHLYCMLFHNNNPFLFIQPVKTEVAHTHPLVVVFHDIVSERDVTEIIRVATEDGMTAAKVGTTSSGEEETASYRTSSSSWLPDQRSKAVERLSRLTGSITRLDMSTSETLQVANYGTAGHYSPHYDDLRPEEVKQALLKGWEMHRRVATFMVYGSDVRLGGATVFPHLNLTIWPEKGSAAFWYNMLPSGEMDTLTLHGGCPVIVGDKWVFNKWISPEGQMFRFPCGESKYDDITLE